MKAPWQKASKKPDQVWEVVRENDLDDFPSMPRPPGRIYGNLAIGKHRRNSTTPGFASLFVLLVARQGHPACLGNKIIPDF